MHERTVIARMPGIILTYTFFRCKRFIHRARGAIKKEKFPDSAITVRDAAASTVLIKRILFIAFYFDFNYDYMDHAP